MGDPFTMTMIGRMKTLSELTLWRVGQHAAGPGRDPDVPIAVIAAHHQSGWAYSIRGDGVQEASFLPGVSPDASELDAQSALVRLVEEATGRAVQAEWTEVDVDTWCAAASFTD